MRLHAFLLALVGVAVLTAGCTRKSTPTPIDGLELKKDEATKFEIKVPTNWKVQQVQGELILSTSKPGITRRFLDFKTGDGGAKIELRAVMLDSTRSLDEIIENSKLEFEDGLDRYELTSSTLGGVPAKKMTVAFDQEDGEYRAEQYFAEQDSVITIVTFAAFGRTFEDYQEQFKEVLASVKCARRPDPPKTYDTLAPTAPEPPSDTLRPYSASEFAIQIPQNFKGSKASSSGLSAVNFEGSRFDCNIRVDVFDASKQNKLDRIIEQNKDNYGGGAAKSIQLGGQPGKYFSYNPQRNISSRAYFVVKGKKMYRITMNWYQPEQSLYLPIFENCLKTLSFK